VGQKRTRGNGRLTSPAVMRFTVSMITAQSVRRASWELLGAGAIRTVLVLSDDGGSGVHGGSSNQNTTRRDIGRSKLRPSVRRWQFGVQEPGLDAVKDRIPVLQTAKHEVDSSPTGLVGSRSLVSIWAPPQFVSCCCALPPSHSGGVKLNPNPYGDIAPTCLQTSRNLRK